METATIIMSVVGPLVGVFAAWMLMKRDARTDAAHALFAKIYTDMQNYRHHFIRHLKITLAYENPVNQPVFPLPYDPEMELKLKESDLNADCLMLGLLFDKKANKAGAAIQGLISCSYKFASRPLPTIDESFMELQRLIQLIANEIKALNASLPKEEEF